MRIMTKIYAPKVGDVVLVKRRAGFIDRQYLAIVVDTTCEQTRVKWLNHPTYPNRSSWVNVRSLEIML